MKVDQKKVALFLVLVIDCMIVFVIGNKIFKPEEEVKAQEKTEEVKAQVEKRTAKKTSSKSKKAESEVENEIRW